MADIDRFDLLFLIYNTQINRRPRGLRFRELMEICNCDPQGTKDSSRPARCSYRTLINYLAELKAGSLLKKRFDPESGRPLYYVPRRQYKKVDELKTRRDFHEFVDSLDARWFVPLRNMVKRIKEEGGDPDPYRLFNKYCFVFMGEIPFAFTKAPGALAKHIAFENRLRKRFHEDIEKFREEFFRTRVEDAEGIGECLKAWKKELGGTITEYYRKLKKKAEKMPFPQKVWFVQGYSEEEMEKMLAEDEKQYASRKKNRIKG